MTKNYRLIIFLVFFSMLALNAMAQDIPEEARKHLIRGKTAMDIARNPGDFELATGEFNQAITLAPEWDEPYLQLGKVYEKTKQYTLAIASLKTFIALTKDASKATEAKEKIYELEFLAEQTLTNESIVTILCEGFSSWEKSGDELYWPYYYLTKFTKTGENSVQLKSTKYSDDGSLFFNVDVNLIITGPVLKFNTYSDQCTPSCPYNISNEIEFVSKTEIIYRQTLMPIMPNSQSTKVEKLTAKFIKK